MREKNKIFLRLLVGLVFLMIKNADAVDVLRPEDEALLNDTMVVQFDEGSTLKGNLQTITVEQSVPVIIQQRTVSPRARYIKAFDKRSVEELRAIEEERRAGFNPQSSPVAIARQNSEKKEDPVFNEFQQSIDSCLDSRAEQLELEKNMAVQVGGYDAMAYLSQTFESIHRCYEDVGRDIIEFYYRNDVTMVDRFERKIKTFYVSGMDVNFSAKNCDGSCTMKDVIDAQMDKFLQYKAYLMDLLNQYQEDK